MTFKVFYEEDGKETPKNITHEKSQATNLFDIKNPKK